MPFVVSKVKISLINYPSYNTLGYVNRTDRSNFTAASNNYYNSGDSFDLNVNSNVNLTHGKGSAALLFSAYDYAFKLFPGYLSFGLNVTLSGGGGSMNFILREIQLNIIAYR